MARLNTESKTREDYHVERWEKILDGGTDLSPDKAARIAERRSAAAVEEEDERIWAWYRDPETDLTQVEARDRAQRTDYPRAYQISQSGVSRRLSELDDAVLSEPLQLLNMRARKDGEGEEDMVSFFSRSEVAGLKRHYFESYLDTARATLAKFLVDVEALGEFRNFQRPTPEWAKQRFPDLDPDLGREYGRKRGFPDEAHEPTDE